LFILGASGACAGPGYPGLRACALRPRLRRGGLTAPLLSLARFGGSRERVKRVFTAQRKPKKRPQYGIEVSGRGSLCKLCVCFAYFALNSSFLYSVFSVAVNQRFIVVNFPDFANPA
jgi:hypothetical protein